MVGVVLLVTLIVCYFCDRSAEFRGDDVFFVDAARSMLERGYYGILGVPETNQPPGFSGMIALLCLARACGHTAVLRAIVAIQGLGLIASYLLLRRVAARAVAAAIVLLVATAPTHFWQPRLVSAAGPLLLSSMSALFLAVWLEEARSRRARVAGALVLALLTVAAISFVSAAMALVGALAVRIVVLLLRHGRARAAAVRALLPALLAGAAVQGYWLTRTPAPLAWPQLNGYPRPYLQQLKLKVGNYPELGLATPGDVVIRVTRNAVGQAHELALAVAHVPWLNEAWMSVAILPWALLVLLGWIASIWRSGGGEVYDWYFAGHEAIYLLWPWNLEARFFIPVIPLACLYVWRGLETLCALSVRRPRLVGGVGLALSGMLAAAAWQWHAGVGVGARLLYGGWQAETSVILWLACAGLTAFMLWRGAHWSEPFAWAFRAPGPGWFGRPRRPAYRVAVPAVVAGLIAIGLVQQVRIGRRTLDPGDPSNSPAPDVAAGKWLGLHTEPGAVIMTRHVPTVYHFSGRKSVWFPPSSNAGVLMDGIRRLHVDYVVVAHRAFEYYLPSDGVCFARLLAAYPDSFRPVARGSLFDVYRVVGS